LIDWSFVCALVLEFCAFLPSPSCTLLFLDLVISFLPQPRPCCLFLSLQVTAKYWDTSRISGAPQRFLTEFLKIRLAEQLAELEAKCEELKDQYQEIVVQVRQRERELRQVI